MIELIMYFTLLALCFGAGALYWINEHLRRIANALEKKIDDKIQRND